MRKIILSFTIITALFGSAFAQVLPPTWEVSLPGNLKWMQVNDWGILIAACENGLFGVNPEDGEKLWEVSSLTNVREENYNVIEGTPLVLIADKGNDAKTMIINGLNGEIIFNSEVEGMQKVLSRKVITEVNGVMIAYSSEERDGVAMFNYLKAEKKWDRSFEKMKGGALQAQPLIDGNGNIFYSNGSNLYRLNGQTGDIIWQKEAKKDYVDLFFHPQGNVVYAVSGNASEAFRANNSEFSAVTMSGGMAGKFQIDAYEVSSGEDVWKKPLSYSKSRYSGVALGEKDFLLIHTLSANVIDFQTGEGVWKKEKIGTGGEMLSGIFATDKGLIYAAADGVGRHFIYYVDEAGEKLWKKKPYVTGNLIHLEQLGNTLFYISTEETNMIDLADGTLLWEKDRYLSAGGAPISFVKDTDGTYVMYVRGKLIRVMPDQRDWVTITSDFAFREELPTGIRRMDSGYLLTGNQNAMLLDERGKVIYHQFFPQPEQSFAAKFALAAVSTATAVYAADQMLGGLDTYKAGLLSGNDALAQKGVNKVNAGIWMSEHVSENLDAAFYRRFSENAAFSNSKLILTKRDKNIGFVKINLATGDEEGQIVTADRTPDFALDVAGDKLFLKSGSGRVACYKL